MPSFAHAHAFAGILHVVSVITLITLANTGFSVPLSIHYSAWVSTNNNSDCSVFKCRTVNHATVVAELNLLTACAAFGLWSALCHALATISLKITDPPHIARLRAIRAADYVVSAPIMILVVYVISGGTDFTAAIACGGLMAAVILVDFFARTNLSFVAATALYTLIWLPIFYTFEEAALSGATVLYNNTLVESAKAPNFVIIIIIAIALAFTSFAVARIACSRTFAAEESVFITLSLVAKTTLHWTLFSSILNRPLVCDSDIAEPTEDSTTMVLTAVAICVSIGLALGIGFYVSLAKQKID
jgi:hypothetical protein